MIIFGVDMSSSVHIDNKKKDILLLAKGPTQGLDGTRLTAKLNIQLIFQDQISLHYNGRNSSFFLIAAKIYYSKQNILK